MSGKYIQYQQIQVYMKGREAGLSQPTAAEIAGFSERSGRRIESGEHQPKYDKERTWRTRHDPFASVWDSELRPKLEREPQLEPTTLYEDLLERYPGQFEGTLRTLQRRVEDWKALHGEAPEVMFALRHEPGELGLSDFTQLKGIEITIAGNPFSHLLYHYRLAYSGWQYVQVIQGGESFIGLSQGMQNAFASSGGVPKQHRTDSLSAAYRNLGSRSRNPQLTRMYEEVCAHYRLQATRNNLGVAHENGAIEASHGHFKRRLKQSLLLRGSFDFATVSEYQSWIETVIAKMNAKCNEKFIQEQQVLQSLPKYRYPDYEVLSAKVSQYSTLTIRCVLYSVPERLVGKRLTVHFYHDRIVGYFNQQQVVELPRIHVHGSEAHRRARCIDYRHLAESLRRKPRAFLYCAWQQEILPNSDWREFWLRLKASVDPDSAARLMVEALYIAATQNNEATVLNYLQTQFRHSTLTLVGLQRHFQLLADTPAPPAIVVEQHNLDLYDQLLHHESDPVSNPEPTTQTPAAQPHAHRLATPRTESHSGAMVLRPVLAGTVRIRDREAQPDPDCSCHLRSPVTRSKIVLQL